MTKDSPKPSPGLLRRGSSAVNSNTYKKIQSSNKGKRERASLADVAKYAGVSVMTVSNVVRGRVDLVKKETRERVQEAIAALKYSPQIYARALRTSRSRTIGLLIVVLDEDFLSSPWTSRMVAGLSNYLNRNDYGLLVHGQTPLRLEDALLSRLANTDGLCVMLSGKPKVRRELLKRVTEIGNPVIALQEDLNPTEFTDLSIVRQDDYGGGVLLGRHLTQKGACRLAFLEPGFSFPALSQRIRGLRSQLPKAANHYVHRIECSTESVKDVITATHSYISKHSLPDAFVAGNERLALGLLRALESRGVSPCRDVKIACFNAFELWTYALPRIPTIDFPAYEVGMRAGRRIIERLERGGFPDAVDVLPARLVQPETFFS